MDKLQAARQLRPGTNWNLQGDVLEQAADGNARVTVPTQQELNAVMDAVAYQDLRRNEYPSLSTLADALVHKENGDDTMYNQYIAACNAVKAQFPKP